MFPQAADNVSSPENCEQVAAWPRRKASDFRAFPSSRFAAWTAQTPRSGVCHQSGQSLSEHFVIEMLSESSGARLISALLIRKALRANG